MGEPGHEPTVAKPDVSAFPNGASDFPRSLGSLDWVDGDKDSTIIIFLEIASPLERERYKPGTCISQTLSFFVAKGKGMKLSLALAFLTATAVQAFDKHAQFNVDKDFMAAMQSKSSIKAASKAGKLLQLQDRLLKASRKLQNNNNQQQGNGKYDAFLADQDGNIYYQGNNGLYYDTNGQQVQPNANGLYPWEYNAIPYDLASRSFKYAGCAAIKTYDVERARENENPMVLDNFAVFRLCPADHCNQYSATGCTKNYGEYAVDIKTYLMYLLAFYNEEYEGFCDYCRPCDYQVQNIAKIETKMCLQAESENQFQYYAQLRQQAYTDYVEANGQKSGNSWNWFGFGGNRGNVYNNGQGMGGWGNGNANNSNSQSNPYGFYNYSANGEVVEGEEGYQSQGYNAQDYNAQQQQYNEENPNAQYDQGEDWVTLRTSEWTNEISASWVTEAHAAYQAGTPYWATDDGYENNAAYQSCKTFVTGMQDQYLAEMQAQNGYNGNNANGANANGGNYYDEDANFQSYNSPTHASAMYDYWKNMDCCVDGSVCDYCQTRVSNAYGFCDDYLCGEYYDHCSDNYKTQQQLEVDLSDFLECSPYEDGNGKQYYIGPHCGSDRYTISLGVFSDESCLNYVGDSISLKSILGSGYSDKDLFQFPEACISCDGMDEYAQYMEEGGTEGRYGMYSNLPDKATDTAFAMCTSLYTLSAQCNEHMTNYEQVSRLMSSQEAADESRSCTFIDNIISGSYDEFGVIQLRDDTFNWNDLRNPHQYRRLRMPVGQALGLSFSIILTIALAAMAYSYQRAFRREGMQSPWSPTAIFRSRHGISKPNPPGAGTSPVVKGKEPPAGSATGIDGNYVMLA